MNQEIILKKNLIGGFDRKQVIDCIAQLQSACSEKVPSADIAEAQNSIDLYTKILKEKINLIDELNAQLNEINNRKKDSLPSSAIKSIAVANQKVLSAQKQAEEITEALCSDIDNKNKKIDTLFLRLASINDQIKKIKASLSNTFLNLEKVNIKFQIDNADLEPQKTGPKPEIKDKENTPITVVNNTIEEDVCSVSPSVFKEDITEKFTEVEENFNSIDNFFAELYKLTNGKLFETPKRPDFNASDDDFEYEY